MLVACVISGLSMLQGGPMPTFFKESVLQRLFENNDLSAAEEQFLKGFDVVGLKRVCIVKDNYKQL